MDVFNRLIGKSLYLASKPAVGIYSDFMLEMDVVQHEIFPKGAKIIAANHPSTTDPFYVAACIGQRSFIMINDLLFQVPLLGSYLRRSGHIPVQIGRGQEAVQSALNLLSAGNTIMIFPEGELSPIEGGFHPARTGVARLAMASGAPVIPVGVHLIRKRIHAIRSVVRGQVSFGHWYLSGPYNVTIGHPKVFQGSVEDRARVRMVSDAIMHQIIELASESKDRLTPANVALQGAYGSL